MSVSYLRLVSDMEASPSAESHSFEPVQVSLIPNRDRTIAVCTADSLSENAIRSLLDDLSPSLILDLRTTPRFDFNNLNRGLALDLFQAIGARYVDIQNSSKVTETEFLSHTISQYASVLAKGTSTASALVFIDAAVDYERIGIQATKALRQETQKPWELLLYGPTLQISSDRQLVFISHANPEDNELAFWLQTQLTRMGYQTWSDLTHLKGGELFWDTIEDVIRNKAARVIALISSSSLTKPGVLDEISLAVSVERTSGIQDFVIPVRVDGVSFSSFRANIARKHILDFSKSWSAGLTAIASTLSRSRAPRGRHSHELSLASWWDQQRAPRLAVVPEPETLVSNRFPLVSSPSRVFSYTGLPTVASGSSPLQPFRSQWLSFMSENELTAIGVGGLQSEAVLSAPEFFAGQLAQTSHLRPDVLRKLFHGMLNRQWLAFLVSKGLGIYTFTGAHPLPYVPNGLIPGNTAQFTDDDGKSRRRLLVGYSTKRELHWHLAFAGNFVNVGITALGSRLRVLFSTNDGSWPSPERMRTVRRSFCKNWWNDRWLSLQRAGFSWLSSGAEDIQLYAGEGGRIAIRATPLSFRSPVRISEPLISSESDGIAENAIDDQFADELDDDDTFEQDNLAETSADES